MNLIRACSKGDLSEVKKMVADKGDVNAADAGGRTPLIEAAWRGAQDIVKYLVEKGASPDTPDSAGFTALMRAAEEGHSTVVSYLIQKGADVNAKGKVRGTTALMLAAEKGHLKVLEVLLTKGAKINAVDLYEETALARAYKANQTKAAEFLESKGGRGKPERSSLSHSDREARGGTRTKVPQWSAAAYEGGSEEAEEPEESMDE